MGADLIKTWQNPFIWAHLCLVTHCSMHHAALWTNTKGRLRATDGNWGVGVAVQASVGIQWSSKDGDN